MELDKWLTQSPRKDRVKRLKLNADTPSSCLVAFPAKRSRAPLRKSVGKLAKLPTLPLDILFEIFGHLHPRDLLAVSRSTKALRSMLTQISATSIWRTALGNVENFPTCPPDLNIVQYSALAFDTHCMYCGTPGVSKVFWRFRLRCCKKCCKNRVSRISAAHLPGTSEDWILGALALEDINGESHYLIGTLSRLTQAYERATLQERVELGLQMRKKLVVLNDHAMECEAWWEAKSDERLVKLESLKSSRNRSIRAKLNDLGYGEELNKLPDDYTDLAIDMGFLLFADHPLVRKAQALTDKVWANIKERMIEYMAEAKAYRIAYAESLRKEEEAKTLRIVQDGRCKEVAMALREWKTKHDQLREWNPSIADVLRAIHNNISIKALVEADPSACDQEIDAATLNAFFDNFRSFCETWRDNRLCQLMEQISQSNNVVWQDFHVSANYRRTLSKLATTVFRCVPVDRWQFCSAHLNSNEDYDGPECHFMFFPEYLHHRCNSIKLCKEKSLGRKCFSPLHLGAGHIEIHRTPWSADHLVFDAKASHVVRKIIEACKMHPATTTVEELDQRNPYLVCLRCTFGNKCDGERLVEARSWRVALRHAMKVHWGDNRVEWEVINEEDAKPLRQEFNENRQSCAAKMVEWRCAYCVDQAEEPDEMTASQLIRHLRTWHLISPPITSEHRFQSRAVTPAQPKMVKIVAQKTKEVVRLPLQPLPL